MKRNTFLVLPAIMLFLLLVATSILAQEQTKVKVTGTEVVTAVVIVDIVLVKEGRYCEVRCNQGAYQCKPLKSGYYLMVELPKNFGMYECKNIEIYAGDIDSRGSWKKWVSTVLLKSKAPSLFKAISLDRRPEYHF